VAGLARLSLVVARTAQTQVLVGSGLVASEAAPLEALAVNLLTRLVVDVVVGLGPGVRVQLDGGAALGEEPHQHVVGRRRGAGLGLGRARRLRHGHSSWLCRWGGWPRPGFHTPTGAVLLVPFHSDRTYGHCPEVRGGCSRAHEP